MTFDELRQHKGTDIPLSWFDEFLKSAHTHVRISDGNERAVVELPETEYPYVYVDVVPYLNLDGTRTGNAYLFECLAFHDPKDAVRGLLKTVAIDHECDL